MAGKEKRRSALRHLTRELVREGFSMAEILASLAEAMEEQSKRIELDPSSREEAEILESEALVLRRIEREHRAEFRA